MYLDSYLELFMTMYGWGFANIIGEMLVGTGLVILPFLVIVFKGWYEAKLSGVEGATALGLLDRIGVELITALFVYATCFAVSPATNLLSINLYHTPLPTATNPAPPTVSRDGGTGSTYDAALASALDGSMSSTGGLGYVPAWWFTVMAISSGVNHSIRSGITASASEFRAVEEMARTATIDDPRLLFNIRRFYSECHVPAKSRYLKLQAGDISPAGQRILAPDNKDYGPSDLNWLGSQFMRTEPGFYADMRSVNPVPGFEVDFSRDVDYYNPASGTDPLYPGYVNPEWGRPTCKEWWEAEPGGIRHDMIHHNTEWQRLWGATQNLFASADRRKDEMARLAQIKANPDFVDPVQALGEDSGGVFRSIGTVLSGMGVFSANWLTYLTVGPLMNGLLMIQSIILMGMYMFLPLVVFFSGYSLKAMLYGAVGIFTVKFWAVLWNITFWIDAHLAAAMYPKGTYWLGDVIQGTNTDYKQALMGILMMGMFIGLPVLWSGMMGWVGLRVGNELTRIADGARSTAEATKKPITKGRG